MPLKKDANREYMREYMRRRRAAQAVSAVKPAAKPGEREAEPDRRLGARADTALKNENAALKARIAELEAELAGERARHSEAEAATKATRATVKAVRVAATPPAAPKPAASLGEERGKPVKSELISKFIRMTGDDSGNEAQQAAQKLISALRANKDDRHTLADLWDKHCEQEARKRPAKPKPINWPEVEAAIIRLADGKATLTMNAVLKAIRAAGSAADAREQETLHRYIFGVMKRLGFTASPSLMSFRR
jgi:hypothetical protein